MDADTMTDLIGLTSAEAALRLRRDGPNRLVPDDRGSRLRHALGPFADPMVVLLLVASGTYVAIGEIADAVAAAVAVVPIAGVGWFLEARAERALAELRRQTSSVTTVWRDGIPIAVPSAELVAGDLVGVAEGDIVPADGVLGRGESAVLDESSLTGEAVPAVRGGGEAIFAGTTVTAGRAHATVTATGARTRYGLIGSLLEQTATPKTPFERTVAHFVSRLALLAGALCAAVLTLELLRGSGWGDAVIAAVSLGIAALPEEFSVVYALYLALGARRLAHVHALVRRLPGVETLGSTTVICTDKTGTLTEGRITVGVVVPVGDDPLPTDELALVALLACEPDPYDPLDRAVAAYAESLGVRAPTGAELVGDWPFLPRGRHVTHVWRLADGSCRTSMKGAVEGVLDAVGADETTRHDALVVHDRLAGSGMRVLALAAGVVPGPTGDRAADESTSRFTGLIAFSDPVRSGVGDALEACRTAGIRVVLVTGDHPATAHALVEGLRLPHGDASGDDLIVIGDELDDVGSDDLDRLVARANVFARVRPDQKYQLVESLRRQGEVVAVTGDGINDAPALRAADIGVAMGGRGVGAAREAATIVLLDDNFATVVDAVREGRRVVDNLARAFAYVVSFHPPLLLAALLCPLLGKPLLLLPIHLVTLELLLHPVMSVVFQADLPDPAIMRRPPRPVAEVLALRSFAGPLAVGLVSGAAVVGAYLVALTRGWPVGEARGFAFAAMLVAQPFLVLGSRSPDRPLWRVPIRPTTQLVGSILAIWAVALAVIYLHPLARVLQVAPFSRSAWFAVIGISAASTLWREPFKLPRPVPAQTEVRPEGDFRP